MDDIEQNIKEDVVRKFNIVKKEKLEASIKENTYTAVIDAAIGGLLALGAVGLTMCAPNSPSPFLTILVAEIPAISSVLAIKGMIQALIRKCGDEKDLERLNDQEFLQELIEKEKKGRGL